MLSEPPADAESSTVRRGPAGGVGVESDSELQSGIRQCELNLAATLPGFLEGARHHGSIDPIERLANLPVQRKDLRIHSDVVVANWPGQSQLTPPRC